MIIRQLFDREIIIFDRTVSSYSHRCPLRALQVRALIIFMSVHPKQWGRQISGILSTLINTSVHPPKMCPNYVQISYTARASRAHSHIYLTIPHRTSNHIHQSRQTRSCRVHQVCPLRAGTLTPWTGKSASTLRRQRVHSSL